MSVLLFCYIVITVVITVEDDFAEEA